MGIPDDLKLLKSYELYEKTNYWIDGKIDNENISEDEKIIINRDYFKNQIVDQLSTNNFTTIKITDRMKTVIPEVRKSKYSILAVRSNNNGKSEVRGIFQELDLISALMDCPGSHDKNECGVKFHNVGTVMTNYQKDDGFVCVDSSEHISSAIEKMNKAEISDILVLDKNKKGSGILAKDAIRSSLTDSFVSLIQARQIKIHLNVHGESNVNGNVFFEYYRKTQNMVCGNINNDQFTKEEKERINVMLFNNLKAGDLSANIGRTINHSDMIKDVVPKLCQSEYELLPVFNKEGKIGNIFRNNDIISALERCHEGEDTCGIRKPDQCEVQFHKVDYVMRNNDQKEAFVSIGSSEPITSVIEKMNKEKKSEILIFEENNSQKISGILTRNTIRKYLVDYIIFILEKEHIKKSPLYQDLERLDKDETVSQNKITPEVFKNTPKGKFMRKVFLQNYKEHMNSGGCVNAGNHN